MAIEVVEIQGFTSCSGYTPANLSVRDARTTEFYQYGQDVRNGSAGTYYVDTDTLKIFRRSDNANYIRVTDGQGNRMGTNDWLCRPSDYTFAGLIFAIDRAQEKGTIYGCFVNTSGLYRYQVDWMTFGNTTTSYSPNAIYNAIIGAIQPQYNWQSVPSITGKGKTVQLSTLNDINDGEEVITDDTSKFNLTTASNLVTLVQK